MNIRVLVDNNTYIDQYYLAEPAVSYYITIDDKHILFDTGYSDILIANAMKMNLDLSKLTHIVISHGHNDHTNGLKHLADSIDLSKIKVIGHPHCFTNRIYEGEYVGPPYLAKEMSKLSQYVPSKEPYFITKDCVFLGQIPRENKFEGCRPIGMQEIEGTWYDDYVLDDSALVCKTTHGLFIITGCSHSGICNIIEYATKVCNDNRIIGVIGGFHLFEMDDRMTQTIQYLKSKEIKNLYPCHCVSLKVKAKMMQDLNINEVGVGLSIDIS